MESTLGTIIGCLTGITIVVIGLFIINRNAKDLTKHKKNLIYLLKHKWHVFRAGLKLSVPLWRLVIHDWSKLSLIEWFAYANKFFAEDPRPQNMHEPGALDDEVSKRFDRAWLHHIHLNPHHWQYWVLRQDEDGVKILEMPEHFVREMVADWVGAGKAQGKTNPIAVSLWYEQNKERMHLHERTRKLVEALITIYIGGNSA